MSNRARLVSFLLAFDLFGPVGPAAAQSVSWTATYDGALTGGWSSGIGPHGIAVDAQGNTYVAGTVNAGEAPEPLYAGGSTSGLIVKYGPSGQAIWARQIEERVVALLLDPQQQPLVLTTFATFKYGSTGDLLWRTPHLFEGRYLVAAAAAPGPGSGIYLAGSTFDESSQNLALARLDGLGRLVWLRTWNGPQGLDDEGQDIGVDAVGRIYVAGRTRKQDSPIVDAYVTAAFDAAGVLLWASALDAPSYSALGAFAADPAGGAFLSVPLGSVVDWRSVKYDASGTVSWSQDFSDADDTAAGRPDFAAVAPDGGVYVSGHRDFPGSTELVRYSASGIQQWVRTGSPGLISPTPGPVLAVDAGGRATVVVNLNTGQLRTTAYDAAGGTIWTKDLAWTFGNPPAPVGLSAAGIAVGPSGEVRIASSRAGDPGGALLTVGYAGDGSFQWGQEPPPVAPDEGAVAVRFDGSGNAIVLASGFGDGQFLFRTLKYDPAGALLWAKEFPGRPTALAVSNAGEAVGAGRTDSPGGSSQFAVVKYDPLGALVWTRTYLPSSLASGAGVVALALDPTGNVYLAGRVTDAGTRVAVIKYAPDGTLLWARIGAYPIAFVTSPGPFLVLSPNGNVIVGGSAYPPPGSTFPYHVWALDPAGNTVWNALGSTGTVGALAVDALGNVIVGDFDSGHVDKLSAAGAPLWSRLAGNRVLGLTVDPSGSTVVASTEIGGNPFASRLTKYGAAGDVLWSQLSNPELTAPWPWPYAMRSTADGRFYVAGWYRDPALGSRQSGYVAAYDPTGQMRWARAYSGVGGSRASFNDLDLTATGRLVAAGYAFGGPTNYDILAQSLTDDTPSPSSFHTVPPCRAFDSRDAALGGPAAVLANTPFEAQVAGRCGLPTTARTVALNVTVTSATDAGHISLFPAGRVPPPTSTINYAAGATRANQAVVGLGDGGRVVVRAIQASGSSHLILDVSGYFE